MNNTNEWVYTTAQENANEALNPGAPIYKTIRRLSEQNEDKRVRGEMCTKSKQHMVDVCVARSMEMDMKCRKVITKARKL